MNKYERQAWNDIRAWRTRKARMRIRRLVPGAVRDGAREIGRKGAHAVRQVPGAEQFTQALSSALEGLLRVLMDVGTASAPQSTPVRRLRRKGYPVKQFQDIRALPLQACDDAFPRGKRFAYIGEGIAQGAVAGVFATIGDVEAFIGAGLTAPVGGFGAAPGAAQVIAAMAGDMAGLLLGATRLAAETGAAYGYDPKDPKEKIFVAGVLSLATAGTETAKWAAYQELSQLTQMLARNATWANLNSNQIVNILTKLYNALGFRLYQRTLSDAVPVVGIILGAGMNANLMSKVADEAYYAYRERRLRETYGEDAIGGVTVQPGGQDAQDGDEKLIPLIEIIEAEVGEGPAD